MKYKKFLTIMLVSVLICTSISAVAMARTSSEEKEIRISAIRGRLSDLFFRIFSAFPAFSAFIARRAPPESHVPATPDAETPEPPQEPIILDFEIHLNGEEFRLGETVEVYATITNMGKTAVYLEEMDVQLGTLDYYIRTPEGYLIHYIGVYMDRIPGIERIAPEETYEARITPINVRGDDVTFGIVPDVDSALQVQPVEYEEFGEGLYVIWGQYTSNLEVIPDSSSLSSDRVFNGELVSEKARFGIFGK